MFCELQYIGDDGAEAGDDEKDDDDGDGFVYMLSSVKRHACEQNNEPFVCASQVKQKSPKKSILSC